MKRLGGVALIAAALMLAGCSTPEPTPTVTVTVTETPLPAPTVTVTVAPAEAESSATPDRGAFVAALTAIDPGLTVNADRAVSRAGDICLDIEQGKTDEQVVRNTELRFEGGNVPDLSADQARGIVDAARAYLC